MRLNRDPRGPVQPGLSRGQGTLTSSDEGRADAPRSLSVTAAGCYGLRVATSRKLRLARRSRPSSPRGERPSREAQEQLGYAVSAG